MVKIITDKLFEEELDYYLDDAYLVLRVNGFAAP